MTTLTPTQRSIYYEQQLTGITANIGGYLRIPCRIDPDVFASAFRFLVHSNDALRLSFRIDQDVPQQSFHPDSCSDLIYLDLSAEADPEAAAEEWMQARFEAPFLSYADGLFEAALLKAREDLYFYHAKGNHLVIDGLSYALMCQRLIAAYKRLRAGTDSDVPTYPSVEMFFEQEEDYLSTQRYQKDKAYWVDQHAGMFRPLFESARAPTDASSVSKRHSLRIAARTYQRIEQLGRVHESSTSAVFIALLYVYFSRMFACEDVVIGLPVHNRRTAELRQTLGPLVNVNAARLAYDGGLTFVALLRQIAADRRRDYRHQRYPVNHLGRELGIYGDGHRRPFDIGFSFEQSDFNLELDGVAITAHHRSNGVQQVPLNFTLCEYGKAHDTWLHLDFQTAVVDEAGASAHLERLDSMMQALLDEPTQVITDISILSARERALLLEAPRRPAQQVEDFFCLHELFENQVKAFAQRTAIVDSLGTALSYEDVNRSANRLARCLVDAGIGAGTRVGIYLNRSVEMMLAVLGVLKAGAAYVPLDHQWPADRCRFIVADAGIELVLTTSTLMEVCPMEGADFLLLEDWTAGDGWMADYSSDDLESAGRVGPSDAAYVLYTSGSTGRPKGAVIEHRSLINYCRHAIRHYMPQEIVGSVVSSPLSFDATITTLLTPLLCGRRVTLLYDGDNGAVLSELCAALFDEGASQLFKLTPPHLDALAAIAHGSGRTNATSHHVLVVGGEQLSRDTLSPWRTTLLASSTFVNEYGPTETVVGCAVYECKPGSDLAVSRSGAIAIGQAIENTRLYVVDPRATVLGGSALQPAGAIGELYIGGVGLARQYLAQPELTAQKFVADPFSQDPSSRLYRTGDLVRRRADGELEFVGRTDHQLKLRGYRIEPGEIEARLREVPDVKEAVVVDRTDPGGERQLVAYIVIPQPLPSETALVAECRNLLHQHLPDYMIPAAFVCLREFPLTTNGKLDRARLPTPAQDAFREASDVEPRNEDEARLCQLWSEILGVSKVGPHDNFFNLGGHSLKATRLVSLMRERLQVEVPLQAVFEHPTVARFARVLEAHPSVVGEVLPELALDGGEYEEGEL